MEITKQELDTFCANILDLEEKKSELATEIKDSIETLAANLEIDVKSVKKFIRAFKEAQKDKDEFVLTDSESDQLLLIAFPEFAVTEAQ